MNMALVADMALNLQHSLTLVTPWGSGVGAPDGAPW